MHIHELTPNFVPIWDVNTDNLCQKLPGNEFPAEIWQMRARGGGTQHFGGIYMCRLISGGGMEVKKITHHEAKKNLH